MYWSRSSWAGSSWPMSYSLSASTPLMPWAAPRTRVIWGEARAVWMTPWALALMTEVGPPDWPMMQAPFNCSMVKKPPLVWLGLLLWKKGFYQVS